MATYVYKAKDPVESACPCQWPGYVVVQSMLAEPLAQCPACSVPVYRAIQKVKLNVRRLKRAVHGTHEYREDLARFSNDPEAYVDGERATARLMDKRKRQGWEMSRDLSSLYDGHAGSAVAPDTQTEREAQLEAYHAAGKAGFSLDDPVVKDYLADCAEDDD